VISPVFLPGSRVCLSLMLIALLNSFLNDKPSFYGYRRTRKAEYYFVGMCERPVSGCGCLTFYSLMLYPVPSFDDYQKRKKEDFSQKFGDSYKNPLLPFLLISFVPSPRLNKQHYHLTTFLHVSWSLTLLLFAPFTMILSLFLSGTLVGFGN